MIIRCLPPDYCVDALSAREQPEYWHLPRSLWQPLRDQGLDGSGITVSVVDTGCQSHPMLIVRESKSFVAGSLPTRDPNGHGTHCCGTVAARDSRIGVAPAADLLVAQALDVRGGGSADDIAASIQWSIDRGADVISLSLGMPHRDPRIAEVIAEATSQGVYVVAAAGNDGQRGGDTIGYPGSDERAICIGSYDRSGRRSQFSSTGRAIDFLCPGGEITSCSNTGGLAVMSGTSMSTPFAAALIALVLQSIDREGGVWPKPPDMIPLIARHCHDIGRPGHDEQSGHGIPDAWQLLTALGNPSLKWA